MSRDDDLGLRVLDHVRQSVVRILKVQRRVRCTGLMDGQHAERELLQTVQQHTYEVVALDACRHQLPCQQVGISIHFTVSQQTVLVDNGRSVRCTPGLFAEHVGKRLADVHIQCLATRQFLHVRHVVVADKRNIVQLANGYTLQGKVFQGRRQALHVRRAIERTIVFQQQCITIQSLRIYRYCQWQLGRVQCEDHRLWHLLRDVIAFQTTLIYIHNFRTDVVPFHHLGKRIETARLGIEELFLRALDGIGHRTGLTHHVTRTGHRQRLYKHAYAVHQVGLHTTIVDTGYINTRLTCHAVQRLQQHGHEEVALRHLVDPAILHDIVAGNGQLQLFVA